MPHIQLYRLRVRRRALDLEIRREKARRTPDAGRLADLARRRSALKAKILLLEAAFSPLHAHPAH
jgi:hypothetical protein